MDISIRYTSRATDEFEGCCRLQLSSLSHRGQPTAQSARFVPPEMPLPKGAQSRGQPASDRFVLQMLFLPESHSRGLKIRNSTATQSNASEVGGDPHQGWGGHSWVPAEPRTEQPHNRISHQPTAHQKAKCLEVKKKKRKRTG